RSRCRLPLRARDGRKARPVRVRTALAAPVLGRAPRTARTSANAGGTSARDRDRTHHEEASMRRPFHRSPISRLNLRGTPRRLLVAAALWLAASTAAAQGAWRQSEFMIGTWEDPIAPALHSSDVHYFQQAKD